MATSNTTYGRRVERCRQQREPAVVEDERAQDATVVELSPAAAENLTTSRSTMTRGITLAHTTLAGSPTGYAAWSTSVATSSRSQCGRTARSARNILLAVGRRTSPLPRCWANSVCARLCSARFADGSG
ncbi:hypothetical protein U9M48_040288 [Paspalum notatum var. saurae]|uniref:Uncharacterized protein n=1 Tax=Paspalum notatum var. saurae TaxID=547442 RepID=A0AAQ3US01_PASNO